MMIKSEYVRSLNKNYERILLENGVDCRRYQYCILFRGGIKYLLTCSCMQMDGSRYLYYDISSSQNVKQMFGEKVIKREWMKEFFWSIRQMRQELNRFLLDERNIVWKPEHIFQDLERNDFLFLYIPYYGQEGEPEDTFEKLLEFWVDRVDYEDSALVEFIYYVYEQYMRAGYSYLEKQIFEDFNKLLESAEQHPGENDALHKALSNHADETEGSIEKAEPDVKEMPSGMERRGIRSLLGRGRKKPEPRDIYREELRQMVAGYAVAEETRYGADAKENNSQPEEFGKTMYIEEKENVVHCLYTEKGEAVVRLEKYPYVLGKRKEDADYVLSDYSASRVHARFIEEKDGIYLEDLNSTNGTYKNGLRMKPYEKRKLEPEDTLRFGKSTFIYK